MDVDDMVTMMNLLDSDGDGTVTKAEFAVYYQRLKECSDAAFETVWKEIDKNGDGELTLNELCEYYGIDTKKCASALKQQKEMSDDKLLEALQLQSLLNDAKQKQDTQKREHARRLAALAALVAEEESEEEEEAD